MDEKINVELWEIPRQDVCFGAVEIEIVFEVTTQLVYDFFTYYGAEITEAGESIVVVVQSVDETLDFSWRWRSVANDLHQGQLVQD
jgi:xylose isomerase